MMKKILALILAALLLLSCAACGNVAPETTEPTTKATEPTTEPTTEAAPDVTEPSTEASTDRTANYIQLSISKADGSYTYLTAYDDDNGKAYVEFSNEVKKVATFELSVLNDIAAQVENSQLKALDGRHVVEEESLDSASMYVGYSDESCMVADFSGTIPQEFLDGYAAVEDYFRQLMADVPVYVPQPLVGEGVDPDCLKEMKTILERSGAEPLDMFAINNVPMDESFTAVMGLSKTEGIVSGLDCSPMMSPMAFSCMIAKAENESHVAAIADDFAANIQWNRWVCVSATNAIVAVKGNLVLCLATTGDLYTQITTAAENTGWIVVKTLTI